MAMGATLEDEDEAATACARTLTVLQLGAHRDLALAATTAAPSRAPRAPAQDPVPVRRYTPPPPSRRAVVKLQIASPRWAAPSLPSERAARSDMYVVRMSLVCRAVCARVISGTFPMQMPRCLNARGARLLFHTPLFAFVFSVSCLRV